MNPNRRAAAAAAMLATVATLGSVLALFHSASSAPGFPADRAAQAIARNDATASRRSGCLETAAARPDAAPDATRVAVR
jgi:hypothetical protein